MAVNSWDVMGWFLSGSQPESWPIKNRHPYQERRFLNKPWSFYSGFLARTSSGFLQTSHRGIFSIPRMASHGDFAPQEFLMLVDSEQELCQYLGRAGLELLK
jgi:hypothetical protein